jgi:hypothetical protein
MNFIKTIVARVVAIVKMVSSAVVNFAVQPFIKSFDKGIDSGMRAIHVAAALVRIVFAMSFVVAVPPALLTFATTWLFYSAVFHGTFLFVRVVDCAFNGEHKAMPMCDIAV